MNFNLQEPLSEAIRMAAADHDDGEVINVGKFKARIETDTTGYYLADLVLASGRKAQARLVITCEESEFTTAAEMPVMMDLEQEWLEEHT